MVAYQILIVEKTQQEKRFQCFKGLGSAQFSLSAGVQLEMTFLNSNIPLQNSTHQKGLLY